MKTTCQNEPCTLTFLVFISFSWKETQEGTPSHLQLQMTVEKRMEMRITTGHALRHRQKRLDLPWYTDSKEEKKLHILPVTNIQPLEFKTKSVFWKTLLEDITSTSTMCFIIFGCTKMHTY